MWIIWGVVLCILKWNAQYAEATCTFPSYLTGIWHGSDFGQAVFTSSRFTLSNKLMKVDSSTFVMSQFNVLTFNCEDQLGNLFYIKSDEFTQFFANFRITMCWQMSTIASTKIVYNTATAVLLNTTNARFRLKSTSSTFSIATDCIINGPYDASTVRVLVKDGQISSAKIDCPEDFLGMFSYEFDKGSGNECSINTYLNTCTDKALLDYNYTACSAVQAYSAEGQLNCVHYATSGDSTYVTVFNLDSSTPDEFTTFRFSCYAISSTTNLTATATQYPQACMPNQNYSSYVSPGAMLTLNKESGCPVVEESNVLSAATVVSIIIVLFLLILVFTIVFYCWKKKKQMKKINPDADPLEVKAPPVDHFDRVGSSVSRCGAVSPYSPYPTLSEIAVFRFGPSPIPDCDGGTTLGGTIAPGLPEDDIAEEMKKRFEYEMDFESDTMTCGPSRPITQGDPDNISLPMYSENGNLTPEPTRICEILEKLENAREEEEGLEEKIPEDEPDKGKEKTNEDLVQQHDCIPTIIDKVEEPDSTKDTADQEENLQEVDNNDKNFIYDSTKIEDDTMPIVDESN